MKKMYELLQTVGVSKSYQGYPYFVLAVEMVMEDESRLCNIRKDVYFPIAIRYKEDVQNIERDIRTIRDVIMRNGGEDFLTELSGGKFSHTKSPYPREIIEIFAEYLKNQT